MIAFVEGSMERQFINANFKYIRVVPVDNGTSWSVEQLCRQIVTSYIAYDKPDEAIVWLDREGRAESASDIRAAIITALNSAGLHAHRAHVLVNDKMSENIMLADEHFIRRLLSDESFTYQFEGKNGKHVLKGLLRKRGVFYKEMIDGVNILKGIRLGRCSQQSPTVAAFLQTFTKPCWWI